MLLCAKGKILLKNDKTDFTQGRILPKLAFFMLPILGALVLQAAYGAVDLLVVGRFGSTSGLSAVSTGSQVLNLVTFVVTQLAMGVTVLIARYLGEKRPQYIGQVIGGAAIVFTLLAAALFVVLVFFARLISSLMQAPAEALDLTASSFPRSGRQPLSADLCTGGVHCECYWRSGAGGWFSSGCCRCRHCYGSSTSRQRNLCNRNAAEEGAALQNPSL